MKKVSIFIAIFLVTILFQHAFAQNSPRKTGIYKLSLNIEGEGGANGISVTYNPDLAIYYAGIAGNTDFPLEVFDSRGKLISTTKISFDSRGLWYSPKRNCLEGVAYASYGYYSISVNKEGKPDSKTAKVKTPFKNPEGQNVAVYVSENDQFVMFYDNYLHFYKAKNAKEVKKIRIESEYMSDYALYTLIWTGKKGYEVGFFNVYNSELDLYDIKTGNRTASIFIPLDYEAPSQFNIAYCNNYFWLFDNEYREWVAYDIWQ